MKHILLSDAYKERIERRLSSIESWQKNRFNDFQPSMISLGDELAATYYLYEENNVIKAKNCYYEAALAQAYLYEVFNRNIFTILRNCLFPILSDNNKIVDRYLSYRAVGPNLKEQVHPDGFQLHFGYAIQSAILNNDESLKVHIDGIRRTGKSGDVNKIVAAADVFEGILNKDKTQVEAGLLEIINKNKRNKNVSLVNIYMNVEATGLAKLAWRKGIEVNINSTFIPQELLPVKELEHYESFDFFKEV